MEFGVPSKRRTAAVDKNAGTPVITLLPFEGENTSRKMEFNKTVYEVMGLKKDDTNNVAFSFNKSNFNDNSIVNTNNVELDASLNLAKNGKISNKSHYEEIKNRYGVSMEEELELTLIDSGVEFQGQKVFKLVTLASVKAAEKATVADDEQPEVAPTSVAEDPSDEERAKLLEVDYTEQLETPGTPEKATSPMSSHTPWGDAMDDDDLLN